MLNKPLRSRCLLRAAAVALSLVVVVTLAGTSKMYAASLVGAVRATFGSFGQLYWVDTDGNPMASGAAGALCPGTCPGDPSGNPSTFLDKVPGGFAFPYDVAVDPLTGDIFVADTYNHRIQVFDSTHQPLPSRAFGGFGTAAGRLNFPHSIAFDALNRRVIVADTYNNRIQAFLPNGAPANVFGGTNVIGGFEWPFGVAVDPAGRVFVANTGQHQVNVFSASGSPLRTIGLGTEGNADGQFNNPWGVEATADRVLVADQVNNRIQVFANDASNSFLFRIGQYDDPLLRWPLGVSVGLAGRIYITDTDRHQVKVFSPTGEQLYSLGTADAAGDAPGTFYGPVGLTVAANGRIYVADTQNHRVQVLEEASLRVDSVTAAAEGPAVAPGNINVDVVVRNDGPATLRDVMVALQREGTAPPPISSEVVATLATGTSHTFHFTVHVDAPGSSRFVATATALDDVSGLALDAESTSNSVLLQPPGSDTTPPTSNVVVSGTQVGGWYRGAVTVTLNATDNAGGSGVKHIRYQYTIGVNNADATVAGATAAFSVITNGPLVVRYWAVDRQGNVEPQQTRTINFDQQPPTVGFDGPFPAANSNGWYRTNVTFRPRFADGESGMLSASQVGVGPIDLVNPTVVITGQGAGLTAAVTASDRAGWTTTAATPAVNIDKTGPEAYNQFSPTQLDVLVYGRDALSGVPAGAVAPTVYPIRWGRHQERDHEHDDWCDEDGRGIAELRSYRVQDRAGNQVSLVEMVKKEGKEIKVYVIGLRYEDANGPGRFIFLWNARKSFEWSVDRNGSLKSLAQMMEVGKDRGRQRVEADYDARNNRTTITVKDGGRERKETRAGLVLLRMASDSGNMVIEY